MGYGVRSLCVELRAGRMPGPFHHQRHLRFCGDDAAETNLSNDFHPAYRIFVVRNLRALATTETEERLMAVAAMIGESRIPKKG